MKPTSHQSIIVLNCCPFFLLQDQLEYELDDLEEDTEYLVQVCWMSLE